MGCRLWLLIWSLLQLGLGESAGCGEESVEESEESEVSTLKLQLLQLGRPSVQRQQLTINPDGSHSESVTALQVSTQRVPENERYSVALAKAFASLSQASFCGADEYLRDWTCQACRAAGFDVVPGTARFVRQAELGEQDSTFVLAARAQWLPSAPEASRLWPPPRPRQPVAHAGEDCYSHCGGNGGYCAWCGVGNACCRQGEDGDPAECAAATGFSGAEHHECVSVAPDAPPAPVPVQHSKEDCWIFCGKAGGFCDWCGAGNACCRGSYKDDPLECRGTVNTSSSQHECVHPKSSVPPPGTHDFGCVLAIRGSRTFTNALHDAFFWSDALPFEDCPNCQVFDGFWRVWSGVHAKVESVLADSGCIPGSQLGRVLVTGHSLGAAVATIAMYTLQAKGYSVGLSYNFESPRVGNDAFQGAFETMFNRSVALWRVTRLRDPTVHLPPQPLYRHVGAEAYFPDNGNASHTMVCLQPEDSRCANRYSLFETIVYGGDHCPSELVPPGRGEGEGLCQCAA